MRFKGLFKFLDSFSGQLLTLIIGGIVLFQVANFAVVCSVQWLYVQQAEQTRAEHLASYWTLLNSMPAAQRDATLARMRDANSSGFVKETLGISNQAPEWGRTDHHLTRQLSLIRSVFEDAGMTAPAITVRRMEGEATLLPQHLPSLEVAVELSDGSWLRITTPHDVDDRAVVWSQRLFVLLESVIMLLLAVVMVRRYTRPIEKLGSAVEMLGHRPDLVDPLPEEGVKEIRNASHSFNLMREQVLGNLEERNRMISAMTHDLRTPLTKLQLRLERVEPQELREKLQATTTEMSSIIVQGLEFARSLTTNEKPIRLELVSFLQSLVDDATDVGGKVALQCEGIGEEETVVVSARTLCLRRCLENLISNVNKYAGEAKVVLQKDAEAVVILVLDNGPGIPEEKLETVFEPYYRLESSRNSMTGGTGLGLCIARNMAALNGAELTLTNREEGGLCAQVRFLRR